MKTIKELKIGLAGWFLFGFIIGIFMSISERTDHEYKLDPSGHLTRVDTPKSGCVYESAASFLSPGYVLACELFRKRFSYEGFSK